MSVTVPSIIKVGILPSSEPSSIRAKPTDSGAPKIGCTPETLRAWHQKHLDQQNPIKVQQISDQEKMRQMEREIKELKRANEILRKAAAFFAQAELAPLHK